MSEIVNPYIAGAPVTEQRMFFGRQDIFQWIENSIAGQYADHILVIHGQRRVGKTSVLKQLGNQLPKRFIPVFFDLQGRTHTTLDHFLWWLAREIVRVLKQERGLDVPPPDKGSFSADPETFENQFLSGLRSMLGKDTLLLTFDEFDNLEESEVKEELARPLIDYLRRMMGEAGLNFIFSIGSSGRKLENMQAAYTEFFKAALYKKISFLSEEQTHQLVTRPVKGVLEYEREAVERIYAITSGHPYFTQLTCHELFARCQRTEQRRIAKADVEAVLEDVVERGTVNLKFIWDEASDIEKWGLAALAQLDKADNRLVAEYLRKNRVRFSETDLASGLLHLREKDVLTPNNRFVIHLMRLWLQKNRPIEQAREELTEANPIANRFIEIGLEFRESGDYEKAIEYFSQALAVSADNLQAQVNIALTYAAQDQLEQAVIEFEKALALDDEDVASRAGLCEAHLKLGDAAMQKGRLKEAAKSYQRVLAINEEHTEARQRMAELARQRAEKALSDGRDEEALETFKEALQYTPEDPALVTRVEQVRVEKKSKIMASLLASSEKEARALNWEAAVKLIEEASALSPEDAKIQERLAEARQKLHAKKLSDLKAQAQGLADAEKFNEALETWQEYLSMHPGDPEQVEAAIAHIKQEQELFETYTNASRAISARDFDQAIRLLKEVINRNENYKDASRLLTRAIEQRRAAPKQKQKEPIAKPERVRKERAPSGAKTSRRFGWIVGGGLAAVALIALGIFFGPKLLGTIPSNPTSTLPVASASPEIAGTITPSAIESIQAYIASTPPDFEDDFSSDKWGDLADGVSTQSLLYDNVLLLTLEYGTNTEKLVLQGPNIEAAQFALEFDFQFEDGNGGTYLDVGFPSLGDGTSGGFTIHMEEQSWTIQLNGTVSNHGEITDPLQGQRVQLQVVYFEKSLAAFLNGKFLGSADGIDHLGTSTWITARTESGAKIWLDNIEFWNLDNVGISSASTEPAGTIPPALIESIQAYTASTPPGFTDDFSSDSYTTEKWDQITEEVKLADFLSDGSLMLNLDAGTDTEKLDFGGPNLQASRFVLEFDFLYEGGMGSPILGVGFPSLSGGINCDATIHLEERKWSIGLSDGTVPHSGEIDESLDGQWAHLQVLYSGTQVAVFLNGNLLGSLDEVTHLGNDIWIVAYSESQAKIRLDNIEFWNLDALSPAAAFAAPILAYTASTSPDFEEDFSTQNDYWSNQANGDKLIADLVSNGVFQLSNAGSENSNLGFNLPVNGQDFALEFDYTLNNNAEDSHLLVSFRIGSVDYYVLKFFNPDWMFALTTENSGIFSEGSTSISLGQAHTFRILALGDQIAIYLDDELLTYIDDASAVPGQDIGIGMYAEAGFDGYLDNVKFWNLDGVKIPSTPAETAPPTLTAATPAPSWVADFSEPILQAIADRTPDFQDDFSQASANWEFRNDSSTGLSNMSIRDGIMLIVIEPYTIGWVRHPALRFKDFALQVNAIFSEWGGYATIPFGYSSATGEKWAIYVNRFGQWRLEFIDSTGTTIVQSSTNDELTRNSDNHGHFPWPGIRRLLERYSSGPSKR